MTANIGTPERIVRIVAGLLRFCPAYCMMGCSTEGKACEQ